MPLASHLWEAEMHSQRHLLYFMGSVRSEKVDKSSLCAGYHFLEFETG